LDREEGGVENLAKKGVTIHSLLGIREAVKILHDKGRIDKNELDAIMKQIKT
jgi:orotate phosphoribosyltransferase